MLGRVSEYDLVCDGCARSLQPEDALVTWRVVDGAERSFALTHVACAPSDATERAEVRRLVWPNGYLRFVGDRIGRVVAEPDGLRAILWALAPFVMRHDSPTEMDSMRAASFGQHLGVKPGTQPAAGAAATKQTEGGK